MSMQYFVCYHMLFILFSHNHVLSSVCIVSTIQILSEPVNTWVTVFFFNNQALSEHKIYCLKKK